LKNIMTSSGIEPTTFWLVTYFLIQLRYSVLNLLLWNVYEIYRAGLCAGNDFDIFGRYSVQVSLGYRLFWLTFLVVILSFSYPITGTKTKLRGLSPQANYTDRATAACRRS
jgi:hypothetical protein